MPSIVAILASYKGCNVQDSRLGYKSTRRAGVQRRRRPERRKKSSERRRHEAIAQFPIITTQGICLRSDRRKIPDRRMSNIIVHETAVSEKVFRVLFSGYLKYKKRSVFNKETLT